MIVRALLAAVCALTFTDAATAQSVRPFGGAAELENRITPELRQDLLEPRIVPAPSSADFFSHFCTPVLFEDRDGEATLECADPNKLLERRRYALPADSRLRATVAAAVVQALQSPADASGRPASFYIFATAKPDRLIPPNRGLPRLLAVQISHPTLKPAQR